MSASADSNPTTSLSQLYQNHIFWLKNWLQARLSCSQQAADLAHDTFVRLLTATDSLQKIASINEPRSYLATVAKRVMIDHFRRRDLELAYQQALANQPEPEMISAEESILILDTLYRFDAMLDGLGSKVKTAFLLSQLQGLTYQQIALELGVTESSVKKYMAKAMAQCLLFAATEQP